MSLSMRSRSIAESTSWSVTSVARRTVNPERTKSTGREESRQEVERLTALEPAAARRLVEAAKGRLVGRTSRNRVSSWMRKWRSSPESGIARGEDERVVSMSSAMP